MSWKREEEKKTKIEAIFNEFLSNKKKKKKLKYFPPKNFFFF